MITPIPESRIHRQDIADPGPGEHLWISVVAFRTGEHIINGLVKGEKPSILFDHENILTVEGPACFKCEQVFTKRLFHRKCTGTMEPTEGE